MPLSAKKGAASYSAGGGAAALKVRRAPIVACLTCPICDNLFREATTVCECLHTFCRACIHTHLGDGETNRCPVCNVILGTLPLEKLRADHQLDDVKAKIFPEVCQARKYGPLISAAPIRRQERDSSCGSDEHEEMDDEEGFQGGENDDDEGSEKQGLLSHPARPIAQGLELEPRSDEGLLPPKAEPRKPLSWGRTTSASGSSLVRPNRHDNAVAFPQDTGTAYHQKVVGPYSAAEGRLATLTEFSGAAHSRDGSQGEKKTKKKKKKVKNLGPGQRSAEAGMGVDLEAQLLERRMQGGSPSRMIPSSLLLQRSTSSSTKFFGNGGMERQQLGTIALEHPGQPANGAPFASISLSNSYGIWFALQAASNQSDKPLPQLASPYLRIKDGKLPVSHVKKYLAKKLGLNNETEVEITCRGQPVVSSLPLESVRNIWFATVPQEQEDSGQATASSGPGMGLAHLNGNSDSELIMVLTYQRHRRHPRVC